MAIDVRADIERRRKKKGVNSDKNILKESRIDVRADIEARRKNTSNVSFPKAVAPAPKIPVIKGAGFAMLENGRREMEAYGGREGYLKALEAKKEVAEYLNEEKRKAEEKVKYENFDVEGAKTKLNDSEYWLSRIEQNRTKVPGKINLDDSEIMSERKQLENDIRGAEAYRARIAAEKKAEEEKKFYSAYNIEAGRGEILNLKNSLVEAKKTETELQQKLNASNRGKTEDRTELRSELDGIKRKISAIETKLGVTEKAVGKAEKAQKQEWYNSIPFAEDFEKYSQGGFYGNYSPREANKIKYGDMTDEEVLIYRYLANKDRENGTRESGAYLESLEEILEYREGIRAGKKAREIDNPLGRGGAILGYAAMSGLTNSIEGTASFLTGKAIEPDALDYAAGYIRNDIDGFAGAAFDVTQSLSNMAPSILLSSITGIPAVGTVAMGASASGNAYSAAISEGYSENQARAYAGLTGASEAVLQYILGGISSLGGKATNNVLAKVINKIDGAGLKLAVNLGGNMVSEGLEEGLQTYLEAAFRKTIFDEELNLKDVSEEAIYSAMLGAVTAFLLEGPGTTVNAYAENAIIKEEYQKKVDALKKAGNAVLPLSNSAQNETVAPVTSGFTKTEYSSKIGNKTLRALDAIGRKLGVNIQIGAPTGDGKGAANGYYQNGTIVIAQDAKNPLEVVLCHEVTHHMKLTAPAEYNAFLELAINASEKLSGIEKSELINRYRQAYSEGTGEAFSDTQALDEITADFASRLVNDISLFNDLANSNRNVALRFIDSLKDFIAKVKSTFSGDKAKADTASQDKYGASVAELETAVAQFEKMLSTTEAAVANGNINTADTDADGGRQYMIKTNSKGKYVKADRMVIFGDDPKSWSTQLEDYINGKIRRGQNVELIAEDGEILTLTADTAGKVASMYNNDGTTMSEEAFERKVNAGSHIDELVQVSVGDGKGNVPDIGSRHGEKASDGWNYRTAYFQDFDGKYYQCTISVMVGEDGNAVYNIGQMRERSFPKSLGSSAANSGAQVQEASSTTIIPDSSSKSNRQNSLKTEDLLSPDYGKTADTSADTEAGESYIKDTGLDTYFDRLEAREQVTAEEEDEENESQVMGEPEEEKKPFLEKISETASFAKRKMLNSGEAIRKIAKTVKDKHLYGTYNRARSAGNIVSDMLGNKQTNIKGQKVGESLEEIISPIKEKGEQYWKDFQRYIFLKHNVARMSLENKAAEEMANAELQEYIKVNSDLPTRTREQLKEMSKREDDGGLRARKYLELQRKLRAAEEKNKPVLFENSKLPLDADKSRWMATQLLRENPEFKEYEAKVRKYVDNLMQYRIDSGLITQEEADYFKKKYPDYVPTYRNTEENMKWVTGKINISTAISKAKGGQEKLLPLDVALSAMTNKVVKNGQKNIFANKVFDLYDKNSELLSGYITEVNEEGRYLDAEFDDIAEEKLLENTVGFYKDGKSVKLSVTPETFEAFETLSNMPKEKIPGVKWWGNIVDTYKKLITTYDVTFGVRNFLKDFQDALIYSTDTKSFLKNFGKAYKEITTGGEMWELYQAAGGLSSSRFEDIQNEGVTKSGKLKKIKEALASFNVMIEQAPRLAEFMTVYEKGDPNSADTLSDALLAAADITTNFGESGSVGKVINRYIVPFLNPSLQGTAKLVRTFTESKSSKAWIGLAVKCTMFGLTAGFFNDFMNKALGGDDDDYENLPDRIKDNYFLFPVGDSGKYIRLPKGRVMAALGIVTDRMRDVAKGEKVDYGAALSGIADNTLPENLLTNNIFKAALLDADLFNEESRGRTWYGTDIENETLQSLPAGERYDNSTDYVSKALGKALGVSPKKLNYILQQYTGGVGRMVLPMITPKEQRGDSVVGKIGYGLWGILTSNFSTDSKLSNKISGEFYDAVDAAEQKKNSAKGTLADKVVYKHLNRERNMVGTYSSKVRAAEVDDNLTSKERQAAVRVASAERTEYQKTILENIDEYREKVEKYLKEYPGKDEEKKLEYAYREANRALYGEEYAIRVNGGSAVHKKAEEKVKRGKTTWKKYYDEYFGKTDRRYDAISDRFGISYSDFEKIEEAISKNSSKSDEIAAIQKLGYKNSIARRIYTLYHDAE